MNNNRNNRRRGRGNRNQGGANSQNRIDSRARGNAPQLLDKYKKLAQDAQHNGDRVQAEYYLQFADHYFRVIADNKARQEEARAKRNEERDQSGDDSDDGEDGGNRRRSSNRRSRSRRDDNENVTEGEVGNEGEAASEGESASEESEEPKRRTRKPRGEGRGEGRAPRRKRSEAKSDDAPAEIDQSVLPPAIGSDDSTDGDKDDSLEAVG
ncbi:DUF4167 domain-containing protein [Erythrobacter sp. YT30]|uniref:DUF4167 domain-containing protein n=1 Tax=Erythrobacter sp. YT30 TaxID=1735012 RepID=UPI00076C974A|nr:DUF4167 domain-containing protein [Erythrobacter sp. YT30]KWV91208.1 hypothetical protein AUC45_07855 [Erythrobacter sp. YT30]